MTAREVANLTSQSAIRLSRLSAQMFGKAAGFEDATPQQIAALEDVLIAVAKLEGTP